MATDEQANNKTGPFLGVIFGASGDLAKRKLMPAIFSLAKDGLLSPQVAILGLSRREMSDEEFRAKIVADMDELAPGQLTKEMQETLLPHFFYMPGDVTDSATYGRIKAKMGAIEAECHTEGNTFPRMR